MTHHKIILSDPMPLREALRGLRFVLRRGGETLVETFTVETLPKPASDLAGAIIREVGSIARSVDEIASDVAKTVLGGTGNGHATLTEMVGRTEDGSRFASSLYVALTSVLARLGAQSIFVSEAAAYSAFQSFDGSGQGRSIAHRAALLTFKLLDARVIRGANLQQAALVQGADLEPASLFAVLLWLQSDRTDEDNEAALMAATDIAVARATEIASACAKRDTARIEALYARYVAHV